MSCSNCLWKVFRKVLLPQFETEDQFSLRSNVFCFTIYMYITCPRNILLIRSTYHLFCDLRPASKSFYKLFSRLDGQCVSDYHDRTFHNFRASNPSIDVSEQNDIWPMANWEALKMSNVRSGYDDTNREKQVLSYQCMSAKNIYHQTTIKGREETPGFWSGLWAGHFFKIDQIELLLGFSFTIIQWNIYSLHVQSFDWQIFITDLNATFFLHSP